MNTVFIIGCGDIGERVAGLCQAKKRSVTGLVRSAESINRLKQAGIEPLQADLTQVKSLNSLPTKKSTVFYLAPPPSDGETDPLIRQFLAAISPDALPEKLVLLSTTAVYGDCRGEWIDETHPVNPQTARGRRRRCACPILRDHRQNSFSAKTTIERMHGIQSTNITYRLLSVSAIAIMKL